LSGTLGRLRGRGPARAAALWAAVALLACGGPRPQPLSVLWVALDAASARYLGVYGNPLPTTPHLDALAEQATLFERAYAQSPATLPSAASYLSGYYPPPLRQRARPKLRRPLAEILREAGLRTAAFSENPFVTRHFGLDTGFETFHEYFPHRAFEAQPFDFPRRDTERTIEDVIEWLGEHAGEPTFVYLHLLPPHAPYAAPPPFRGRFDHDYRGLMNDLQALVAIDRGLIRASPADVEHLRAQYQENLAYVDAQVGRLVDFLEERGLLDRTLLILSADHGEAFLEHGRMLHNSTVYEEMIHVPLIIRFPSRLGALPERWSGVVELTDVLPTICDALGIPLPRPRHGRSLLSVLAAGEDPGALARSWTSMERGARAAVIQRDRKLVVDADANRVEYYDLKEDPLETRDLAAESAPAVEELRAMLEAAELEAIEVEPLELDAPTRARLEALGYVDAPRSRVDAETRP